MLIRSPLKSLRKRPELLSQTSTEQRRDTTQIWKSFRNPFRSGSTKRHGFYRSQAFGNAFIYNRKLEISINKIPQNSNNKGFFRGVIGLSGAYIALLIGGAFATGQEAMQFFVGYGAFSLPGLVLCLLLMVYTSWSLIRAGKTRNLVNHEQAFRYFCGDIIGVVMTWYTMLMIVTVYGVMLSGVGATLEQAYGLPTLIGSSLMAFCAAGTLLLGLQGIIKLLGVIGPAIVFLTIATAIGSFLAKDLISKMGCDLQLKQPSCVLLVIGCFREFSMSDWQCLV